MSIILFDVDGTICESGKKITIEMACKINDLIYKNNKVGIVGGGTFEKILFQLDELIYPHYIFSECGSVYHILNSDKTYSLVNKNNIRDEPEYIKINTLIKVCLDFLSKVDYTLSGHFIDLRSGLIYVSLVGMVATEEERVKFINLDIINNYREKLLDLLNTKSTELGLNNYIDICLGGSVGIAIYPKKWNKTQVLHYLDTNNTEIHFFGDKYLPNGNDYELISHPLIKPHCVDSPEHTLAELIKFF